MINVLLLKLKTDKFTAKLKQVNSASKNDIADFVKKKDFDDRLSYFK